MTNRAELRATAEGMVSGKTISVYEAGQLAVKWSQLAHPIAVLSLLDELDAKDNTLLALTTRHFAESWSRRSTDAKLDEYLSAGIAKLQEERDVAMAALGRAYENYNKVSFASSERGKLIEDLRVELQAAKLLLEQCNEVIEEDGGVYIELRCFLSGEMPASDVIALLGKGNRNA